jgi:hypothetical protein
MPSVCVREQKGGKESESVRVRRERARAGWQQRAREREREYEEHSPSRQLSTEITIVDTTDLSISTANEKGLVASCP